MPPGFPYFYVQFGYAKGFAHVIDDEATFDRDFGRQVAVGLLKLPAEEMHRRSKAEPQVRAFVRPPLLAPLIVCSCLLCLQFGTCASLRLYACTHTQHTNTHDTLFFAGRAGARRRRVPARL